MCGCRMIWGKSDHVNGPHAVATLFRDSGIALPYDHLARVTQMVQHAPLMVTVLAAAQ